MVIDLRGYSEEESLRRIRDIIRCYSEEEVLDILIGSEGLAKKVKAFMSMSGVKVECYQNSSGWIIKIIERTCNCL